MEVSRRNSARAASTSGWKAAATGGLLLAIAVFSFTMIGVFGGLFHNSPSLYCTLHPSSPEAVAILDENLEATAVTGSFSWVPLGVTCHYAGVDGDMVATAPSLAPTAAIALSLGLAALSLAYLAVAAAQRAGRGRLHP